jgi:hypothetical protein
MAETGAERRYDADARAEGYTRFMRYGAAFYKKNAAVRYDRIVEGLMRRAQIFNANWNMRMGRCECGR